MNAASSVLVVDDDVLVRDVVGRYLSRAGYHVTLVEVDAVLEAAATDSPDGSVTGERIPSRRWPPCSGGWDCSPCCPSPAGPRETTSCT
ncbi:MAG: hypothetical protein M3325_08135 [Actinomycetota bacterium]|nr:hypothetical protein [Actinomycetota bacterium]